MSTDLSISTEHARRLTDRIRIALDGTWHLIVEAYESRAWSALGYDSWDDYCKSEFSGIYLKLPREERAQEVRSLREHGLSLRAISSARGVAINTVRKDLEQVYQNDTPEPVTPSEEHTPSPTPAPRITGMDGKQYSRPEPQSTPETQKPKRRPLGEQARDAGWDARKITERIQRIISDDRYARNKEEVATLLRSHLQFAVETYTEILDHLDS